MSEQYIGALDAGTTSTRFIIFDHEARIVSQVQRDHTQIFPQQGWVEHDPLEIWTNAGLVMQQALAKAQLRPEALAAIGITNQRETTVVWDRHTGIPVYNAIVWQDLRTEPLCTEWTKQGLAPDLARITGLPISPYFAASKIRWILDNTEDGIQKAARGDLCFGTIDTWLLWQLTADNRHVTDVTNASRTLFMDLHQCEWHEGILAALGIPGEILPTILPSSDAHGYGTTDPKGPLGQSVPIMAVLGDQQAATVGQTCFKPGEAKNTYGTGCFLLLNTGTDIIQSQNGLISTVAYQFGASSPCYALEGSIAMGGATVQWLRDEMGLIADASETEQLASDVTDNGGCYFVPAFSGLFAPHWRADARGVIVGLTRYVTKAHLVRAALEAICYQTREVLDAMQEDSGVPLEVLHVDGGATVNNFLMQLQADVLGTPVAKPVIAETTSLGAAYAAGLATGYWGSVEELKANLQIAARWEPNSTAEERRAGLALWNKAVQRTLNWAN